MVWFELRLRPYTNASNDLTALFDEPSAENGIINLSDAAKAIVVYMEKLGLQDGYN